MRLLRAEILKMRRRTATYVMLIVAIVITALVYLAIGRGLGGFACGFDIDVPGVGACLVEFPAAYALIGQFAFTSLGGLLAIVYAAAIVGSDWSWGVLRNIIARGESRARYLLGKAGAIAIVLGVGVLIIFFFAMLMTFVGAGINGIPVANPLRGDGLTDMLINLALGFAVVLERAAIGFAVAVVLRSQLAGAVVGVVLYVGEGVLTTFLAVATFVSSVGGGFDPEGGFGEGLQVAGPEWYQFLPISIGDQVLRAAPGVASSPGTGGVSGLFLRPVPLELALPTLLIYMVVALAVAVIALNRQEIT